MSITVRYTEDPVEALAMARPFLANEPVLHNVILTLLTERAAHPEPGRYWVPLDDGAAAGFVFQSPLTFWASLACMTPDVIEAAVDSVADQGVRLPGAIGEVSTVARFAGQWTERHKSGATPLGGQRIYEVEHVTEQTARGGLREATKDDRNLVVSWLRAFQAEADDGASDPEAIVDQRRWWLWDDGGPVSLARPSEPVEGVARIGPVYTPPERRNRGYAGACVSALSAQVLKSGQRCILYTDLANPTSNAIYRRIGYRAVAEVLRYRFE
jgi:hypothetical protein